MVIGNMRINFGEDRTCSSEDIIADRQIHTETDIHAHHNTSLPYRGGSKTSVNFVPFHYLSKAHNVTKIRP